MGDDRPREVRNTGRVRLLILDRDLVTCRALAHAFNAYDDIRVVGYATSAREIEEDEAAGEFDVVLASRHVPDLSIVRLASQMTESGSEVRLVVTGLEESEWLIMRFAEAGVDGYVFEDADVPRLVEAVRSAKRGEALVSPRMAYRMMKRLAALYSRYRASGLDASLLTRLTGREREILGLIGRKMSNRQVADELGISLATVKSHVHNLLKKLQVGSREEAAAYLLLETDDPESEEQG